MQNQEISVQSLFRSWTSGNELDDCNCVVLYQKELLQISIIHFIHFFIHRWEIPPTYVNAFYDVARNKMGNLFAFESFK